MSFGDNEEATSSYVVGQLWGQFGADKYLIRQVRERMEFTEAVAAVHELTGWADENYPTRKGHMKLAEDKANGPAVISQLGQLIPGMVGVNPQGDKSARPRAVAPQVEAGNVYLRGIECQAHRLRPVGHADVGQAARARRSRRRPRRPGRRALAGAHADGGFLGEHAVVREAARR